jgi:hypothetical protein
VRLRGACTSHQLARQVPVQPICEGSRRKDGRARGTGSARWPVPRCSKSQPAGCGATACLTMYCWGVPQALSSCSASAHRSGRACWWPIPCGMAPVTRTATQTPQEGEAPSKQSLRAAITQTPTCNEHGHSHHSPERQHSGECEHLHTHQWHANTSGCSRPPATLPRSSTRPSLLLTVCLLVLSLPPILLGLLLLGAGASSDAFLAMLLDGACVPQYVGPCHTGAALRAWRWMVCCSRSQRCKPTPAPLVPASMLQALQGRPSLTGCHVLPANTWSQALFMMLYKCTVQACTMGTRNRHQGSPPRRLPESKVAVSNSVARLCLWTKRDVVRADGLAGSRAFTQLSPMGCPGACAAHTCGHVRQ